MLADKLDTVLRAQHFKALVDIFALLPSRQPGFPVESFSLARDILGSSSCLLFSLKARKLNNHVLNSFGSSSALAIDLQCFIVRRKNEDILTIEEPVASDANNVDF